MSTELSEVERDALTVLALVNEPVSRTEWMRLMRAVGLEVNGKALHSRWMGRFCELAVGEDLAIADRSPSAQGCMYRASASMALMYLGEAHERGALEELYRGVAAVKGYTDDQTWRYTYGESRWAKYGTDLRVAVVRGDAERAQWALKAIDRFRTRKSELEATARWMVEMLGSDPPPATLELLGDVYGVRFVQTLVTRAVERLRSLPAIAIEASAKNPGLRLVIAKHLCVQGREAEATALELSSGGRDAVRLLGAFWSGDFAGAIESASAAVDSMSKRRKHRQLGGLEGLCHALARVVVSHQDSGEWSALGRSIEDARSAKAGFPIAYAALGVFHDAASAGREVSAGALLEAVGYYRGDWNLAAWPSVLVVGLVHVWTGQRADWVERALGQWVERARTGGYERLSFELSAIVTALSGAAPPAGSLAAGYQPREAWEVALDTLEALVAEPGAVAEAPESDVVRILWEVSLGRSHVSVQPRQIRGTRAKKGKKVSLAKMLDGKVEGLSDHDRRVLSFVELVERDAWSRGKKVPVLRERALIGLIDHPYVARPDGTVLTVSRGEPGLSVESVDGELRLVMQPPQLFESALAHEEQSHGHVIVYERTLALERMSRAFSKETLSFPKQAGERLGRILGGLGSQTRITASADIEIEGDDVTPDSRVVVVLRWDGTTLYVRLRVAPLGLAGPHLRLREGSESLAATVDGRPLRTQRDFGEERAGLDRLLDACPTVAGLPQQAGEARAEELFVALEVLIELERMGDAVVLAWPRGQRLATPTVRGTEHVRVRVKQSNDWLTVDTKLPVDEKTVLGFRELLERRRGRFIELEGSRFVALTEQLRRQLDALEGLGKVQKKGLVVSPVVLPLVEELTREAGKRTMDAASMQRLEGLERAAKMNPQVPRGFEAELRDYQQEGYVWMARLAEAGLGAVLADDMGLGKTVQTLALLLARRSRGPALVVAPTSVASNWIDEARRFAPALRPISLATGDREAIAKELGPKDLLVCSYGLLVTEAERLGAIAFDTVVFDEGHMLKNARTKRARAAGALKAAFRLALTGTPIENHLGELWSLLQVTVPGLLSTEKHFETRFAGPIRGGDRERAKQLRALLRPFLLRRTKAQVLDELPARTEVTIRVTPTDAERAFYEAVRRRALEQLASPNREGGGRLQVLAEITRLRQAAVDPRVLDPKGPPGAKIDTLLERLLALRAEGHRALVFSQFLGGMQRVRERLDEAGITYLDLDGSTPAKERARRIAAFQDGAVDVFVMSLKAGGVGVNLTAADYVIHLDPWWNPAVEEQATGRAHRIGQERPVTVYRLVTEGTIEERILALHRDKRELAADLLGNMDRAKKLDVDELRALL